MASYKSSEQTKKALIDAAGELFAAHGIDAVSTRMIADRAGENIGSIHYHFGGKEGLLHEAVRYATSGWQDDPLGKLFEENEPLFETPEGRAELVRRLVRLYFSIIYAPDKPGWCGPLIYLAFSRPGPVNDWAMQAIVHPHLKYLSDFVQRLRPELDDLGAELAACCIVSPISYFSIHRPMLFSIFGLSRYSPEFLLQVEEQVVQMVTCSFGLPYRSLLLDTDSVSPDPK